MKTKVLIGVGFVVIAFVAVFSMMINREKSLAVEVAELHLAQQANQTEHNANNLTYAIKDIDNYGRNWTIWAQNINGQAVAVNVFASRGLGPVPIFNTLNSLIITGVEHPMNVKK